MIPVLAGDDDWEYDWYAEYGDELMFTEDCDLDCTLCYPFD